MKNKYVFKLKSLVKKGIVKLAKRANVGPLDLYDAVRGEASSKTILDENLYGQKLSHHSQLNVIALANRAWVKPDYHFEDIKPQHRLYVDLVPKYPYSGQVQVGVYGIDDFIMWSDADDAVAITYFLFGADSYETLSIALYAELARSSKTILDIGAYTGIYSLVAAMGNSAAEIHAFEPIPQTAKRIEYNALLNGVDNINVHMMAISNTNSVKPFTIYGTSDATTGASLRDKPHERKWIHREIDVEVKSVDSIFTEKDQVDLVKIDTEYDEINTLIGAVDMIARSRPIIFAEVLNQESLATIFNFLAKHDYKFGYLNERTLDLNVVNDPTVDDVIGKYGWGNLACFPDEESLNKALSFCTDIQSKLLKVRNASGQ